MLTRRIRTTLDWAFLGEALRALQKELRSLTPTLLAARPYVPAHDSDSPTLWRTAAVMRNRRDVLDGFDLETSGCERLNGRFATAARSLYAHVDPLDAEAHRFTRALLGRDRRRERRALLR